MNHGEQSAIEVPWHCWMWANLSPVAVKYNSSYNLRKIAIWPLILFVLMWNFLFRCQIFCKNNHIFFNFSTGNVYELTSHSHHSGWATWAGPGAGHPTERARAWDSGSCTSGKPLSWGHQPRGYSSVMLAAYSAWVRLRLRCSVLHVLVRHSHRYRLPDTRLVIHGGQGWAIPIQCWARSVPFSTALLLKSGWQIRSARCPDPALPSPVAGNACAHSRVPCPHTC